MFSENAVRGQLLSCYFLHFQVLKFLHFLKKKKKQNFIGQPRYFFTNEIEITLKLKLIRKKSIFSKINSSIYVLLFSQDEMSVLV